MASAEELAERAFNAYGEDAQWLTHDGKPMPRWEALGDSRAGQATRRHWAAAVALVTGRLRAPPGGLPAEIEAIDADLASLLADPATSRANVDAALLLMISMLHVAVYGSTWARPESPREVWRGLLAEVIRARATVRPSRAG
jgi:hypothetical protein